MPNMFSRRRGSSNPPVDRSTMNAAAAAAGSAFLQSSASQASLSSAAAAAALRSQTSSPEPVGNLVTKRMVRRGSVSSVGSGSVIGSSARGGVGRGGLQRQNSGGSMTERTFRSPSPGRSNGAVSPAPDAPPVPALPKNLPAGHKRASSLEPPQRVTSPTPKRGGRGVSVDRGNVAPPATSRHSKRLSGVSEAEEVERQNSGNVNFSRPMSSVQGSPVTPSPAGPAKKYTHGTGSWFTQPGGDGSADNARPTTSGGSLPSQRADAGFTQQEVQNAANKSVKKKKSINAAEGSHLAQANKDSGAGYEGNAGTSYESQDSVMVYDPNTRTFTAQPRNTPQQTEPASPTVAEAATPTPAPGTYDPHTRKLVPGAPQAASTLSGTPSASSLDTTAPTSKKKQRPTPPPVETKLEPPPRNPARISPGGSPTSPRAAGRLHHQPSVVREDPEAEEAAAAGGPLAANLKNTGRTIQTSAGPAKMYVAPSTPHQRSSSLDIPRGSNEGGGRGRIGSISPARSAHFSASPVIEATRHVPPPRSISPVKSAMKHSPASSERAASPMATFSPSGPKAPPSDASDTTSLASQDGFLPHSRKKKSVRVSFDEHPEVVEAAGAAAQPKAITRERSPVVEDEMEELMKPRPALPSFGSVRRKPEMAEKVTEMPPERQGGSSDRVIGGILANANAGKGKRGEQVEPLVPEVTSKEAGGDVSEESEAEEVPGSAAIGKTETEAGKGEPKTRDFATEAAGRLAPVEQQATGNENGDVPAINLLPPTPGETPGDQAGKQLGEEELQEVAIHESPKAKSSFEAFNVPGSWAASVWAAVGSSSDDQSEEHTVETTPAKPAVSEPSPPAKQDLDLAPIDEDSDDSAAFSDAAEDLSDLEDGGFASMDAIAVSPLAPSSADKGKAPAATVPSGAMAAEPDSPSLGGHNRAGQGPSGDWGEATAYWKQLSRHQREQIEREHLSSDDEAKAVMAMATKKPRKKKSALKAGDVGAGESSRAAVQPPQQKTGTSQPIGSQTAMPKTMRAKQGPAPATSSSSAAAAGGAGDGEVHMRRSMRSGPAPASSAPTAKDLGNGEVHMRRSMRSGPGAGSGGGMASSLRSGGPPSQQQRPQSEYIAPRSALQKGSMAARPMSSGGAQQQQRPRTASDAMPTLQDSSFPTMRSKQTPKQPAVPAVPSGGAFTAKLQKQVTNDSDSESSFKKNRRRRGPSVSTVDSSAGRYTMKRSMRSRADSIDERASIDQRPTSPTPGQKRGGGAFSIRSLSPSGSMFGRGRVRGDKLRESLRSGSVDAGPAGPKRTTLRNGGQSAGRAAPTMRPSTAGGAGASAPSKPRFRSKFGADSDDEDEGRPAPRSGGFRSRFADSDDEDAASPPRVMAADLAPVRGIPRRRGQEDGDSTDLEDEDERQSRPIVADDAAMEKAMEAARRKLGMPAAGAGAPAATAATNGAAGETREGNALGRGSLRQNAVVDEPVEPKSRVEDVQLVGNGTPEKKRRGFMGTILRRNRNSSMSVQQVAPSSPIAAASPTTQAQTQSPGSPQVGAASSPQTSKPQDASAPSSPSFAKLVRRGSQQPKMKRGDSTFSTATAPAGGAEPDASWPLPPVPKIMANGVGSADRPSTADGVTTPNPEAVKLAQTMRPDLKPRSQSGRELGSRVRIAAGSKEEDGGSEMGAVGAGSPGRGDIYSARTGRKKRFPMLRRAFGLND